MPGLQKYADAKFENYFAKYSKGKGTVYTDATDGLPVMSLDGKQYYVVAYDYNNNYIGALPVAALKDTMIVEMVKTIFKAMEEKGHRP